MALPKNVLKELADSDLSKVFKIKGIDEGYSTLANHGLRATLAQMKAIGDLSAGTGRDFNQVIDAIVRGGEGRFESLKSLGVDVSRDKDKKAGIDNLTLSFRGQTQTIKNNADAIQAYILSLGTIPAIQGSMAKSADTVEASENNLNNQMKKIWENLGERFNPSVVESKNHLSKWVATINSWIEIPTSEKIAKETQHLQQLKTELGFSNTTEARRLEILREVKNIQPDIVDGTKSEKDQLDQLSNSLDSYIGKRRQQIALEQLKEQNLSDVTSFQEAQARQLKTQGSADAAVGIANTLGFNSTGMSQGEAQIKARTFLENRIKTGKESNYKSDLAVSGGTGGVGGGVSSYTTSDERKALSLLDESVRLNKKATNNAQKYLPGYQQYQNAQAAIKKLLPGQASPLDSIAGVDKNVGDVAKNKTSIDKGGIASVHGGGQIRNITINIQNLVSGGVNLKTETLKEGMSKAKDIVVEGLLTAVNDANLVGN